jgi:hypothetical protein
MLIAHLKAHLVTGETVDLLPVRHETDVKKELTGLLEGWASYELSGHLPLRLPATASNLAPGLPEGRHSPRCYPAPCRVHA